MTINEQLSVGTALLFLSWAIAFAAGIYDAPKHNTRWETIPVSELSHYSWKGTFQE